MFRREKAKEIKLMRERKQLKFAHNKIKSKLKERRKEVKVEVEVEVEVEGEKEESRKWKERSI